MNPPENMVVDHINFNKLDNAQNRPKMKNSSSDYYGVTYTTQGKKFYMD